jgi:hypothetical protein
MAMPRTTSGELQNSTESDVNAQNRRRISYWVAAFFFFIFPSIMVSLPWIPIWLGRLIAVSTFTFFGTLAIFWYGLSPRSKMIRKGGKLNEPRFNRVRPKIERVMRALIVGFGAFFSFYVTLPLASDLVHLAAGEKPAIITGIPADKSVPLGGLWFLKQSVRFGREADSYSLFYSWKPLRVDASYEFVVLPRSRVILDFRESGR